MSLHIRTVRYITLICSSRSIPDPAQNQSQNRNRTISRGKNEDATSSEIPIARRSGFDSRAKSGGMLSSDLSRSRLLLIPCSSVNPEDIVLGPPRTSFASAGRKSGNALDMPPRLGPTTQDKDTQKDRNSYKDRFPREGLKNEKNGEQSRDLRPGARPRSDKADSDVWSNARGQRSSVQEDQDQSFRRNGDRELDKDRRDDRRPREFGRDGTRNTNGEGVERRGWEPRSRNQSSWARDENLKDVMGVEGENSRPRGWREKEPRRDNRGQDKHWNRGGRQEMDPEWMDEPEPEEKKQAYTADDFEQWKAKMKAGNGGGQDPPMESKRKQSLDDDDTFGDAASPVAKPTTSKDSKPLLLDSEFDGFFGLGKQEPTPKEKQENGAPRNMSGTSGKGSKASKFSTLFTSATKTALPVLENVHEPEPASVNDSSDADKEGFARILSLLGGQQQPQAENGTPPQQTKSRQKTSISSPLHSPPPGTYNNDPFSGMLGQRSPPPVNQMPQNMDQQFLLGLMHQKQQSRPEVHAGNRRPYDVPPSVPFSNMTISPDHARQQSNGPPPGFIQDAFRDEIPRDKLNPTTGGEQRRPPPGFHDMGILPGMARPSPQPPGLPPGMRPPGFDMPPQQHRPNQNMGPPPGFPPGMQRGQGAFPPGLMPGMQERQQFGMRPNGPGMPPPPPPPGFMGMNGPPPGFPNMPFTQDGGMPFGGGFVDFGPGGPQQGFPGQGRR